MKEIAIGISGASGVVYGVELVSYALKKGCMVHCVASDTAKFIMKDELGCDDIWKALENLGQNEPEELANLRIYANDDFYSPIASGSFPFDAMAISPCSMKTLGLLAGGIAQNLICRAAEVALKEHRKLIIVPRETPLALTHLRNMTALAEAGAVIMPACPAFYTGNFENPKSAINFMTARTAAAMGIKQDLIKPWGAK